MAAKKKAAKAAADAPQKVSQGAGNEAAAKLRAKNAEELNDELLKLRKEQFSLRMQRATGQSPKPDQFGKVRRNVARLKTVQREARKSESPATGGKKS